MNAREEAAASAVGASDQKMSNGDSSEEKASLPGIHPDRDIFCNIRTEYTVDKAKSEEVEILLQLGSIAGRRHDSQYRGEWKAGGDCASPVEANEIYFLKMKQAAEKIAPMTLLPVVARKDWEENINRLIPKNLRKKYVEMFADQMLEIKARYTRDMHKLALRRVMVMQCEEECNADEGTRIRPYKLDGRSGVYGKYLRIRQIMEKHYYLPHKLMRNILAKSYVLMPERICDLGRYKSLGYIDFPRFLDLVEADMKKAGQAVTTTYYGEIVRLFCQVQYQHAFENFTSPLSVPEFRECANNLLSRQIISLLISSVDGMLRIVADESAMPLFKLELKCEENEIFLYPRIREILAAFHGFIQQLGSIAQDLPSLESWLGLKSDRAARKALLPEWYAQEAHYQLEQLLPTAFSRISRYIDELGERYAVVFDAETPKRIGARTTDQWTFEEYVGKVEELNDFVQEINGMPEHEYFSIGKVNQVPGKAGLLQYTNLVRDLIIEQLVKKHRQHNLEICESFENMARRALDVPDTTKELLELGKYMLYAASTLMSELREKIAISLRMTATLIGMTSLTKDHLELNNQTIDWLTRIRKVLEQNSSMYEQTKFELEEKLQERVEDLNAQVENAFPRLVTMNDMDDGTRVREYVEHMRKFVLELEGMEEKAKEINDEEALFQFPLTSYPRITELRENILPYYELVYRGVRWQRHRDVWLDGPFENIDAFHVENKANEYFAEFTKSSKQYKTKIKMQIAMSYPYTFQGSPDEPDPLQQPAPLKLCYQYLEDIRWFKQYIPLLMVFRNPAMRQLHWNDLSAIAGFDLTPDAGTTFRKIINLDLMDDIDKYELISISATKEQALEDLLKKMLAEWENIIFTTTLYKDTGVQILTQLDDIQALLEEHLIKVQAMRGSAFVKLIESDVKDFYALLLGIQATIEEWIKVQVQWMYLLPIFSSKDIIAQLPDENLLYQQVDGIFRNAMLATAKKPRVCDAAGSVGVLEMMQEANLLLERVNNGVLNYLEKKRLFFPRFFFLSNDDMLEILSETKEPLRVQPHLRKCFEGINRLGFDSELEIYSMISEDKEEVGMQERISTGAARGCVERWLLQVEKEMVRSVRRETLMSYLDYEANERRTWVLIWPGMVVLCVSQIYWSIDVQNCLMTRIPSTMDNLHEKLKWQILTMVEIVRGPLSKQNRTTLNALITIDVHAMDVVSLLIEKKIMDERDFEWLAQLRYYWEDDVIVRVIYASVAYAYEYVGNCPRLVITPLTDRCYRTLVGAYSLHLNGAPEGPAGTGKTETTKDLSRAVAVQCVVFNCSEGLDYKNMGKFFKGLASCGAWSCFDEFNRIDLEVLSVIAQQILCIIQAVRAGLESFVFEGTELNLNPAVYVCITMNPGYAGRSELPDNLKVLFRTVAMMVPDYAMIAEIFLYSSGFGSARELSTKIVTTYKLCSEQLSTQRHYDYGMRAVKTVLTAAQNIKLKYPRENEAVLLLRSVIDVNLPKFLAHDVPLFQGIVSDLFPGLELPSPSYELLFKAVHQVAKKRNLQPVDAFFLKIVQTFETMMVRHGFMLVGEPFGGKTTVLHTLADALGLMHEWADANGALTNYFTINPKSVSLGRLYGFFDPVSSEWTDGICAVAFRQFSVQDTPDRKWIILDGPVDALWIENLNTVLDDNKKLCLTSGEVMQMTPVMSMIFETMDLADASPATVSRCGMVYIEPRNLGWQPFFHSWIEEANPLWRNGYEDSIYAIWNWLLDPCLEFIRKKCRVTITAGQIHQVRSSLSLLELFMNDAIEDNTKDPKYEQHILTWLQASTLLAIVWGAAGTLDYESRLRFNSFFLNCWKGEEAAHPLPECIAEEKLISLPLDEPIHDCYYTYRGKGAWRQYADLCKAEHMDESESLVRVMVPTVDTVKYQALFARHIKHNKRFLLYGETGTGKSFYIKDLMMKKLENDVYLPHFLTFTPTTTSWQTQELIILKLYKRRRNQYGPLPGTKSLVFIDDVNMPAKEEYGSQPAIELLRQLFDHGIWFDLRKPERIFLHDTMFICAMAPPGGSRQEIYQRFLRHFHLFAISAFSKDSVHRIFTNIAFIGMKRNGFTTAVLSVINDIVHATGNIFEKAAAELRPTPAKSHYLFNLRDFSRVITACAMIQAETVQSKADLAKLWVHEVLRVFGDRLIDENDRRWLFLQIRDIVQTILRENFDALFNHLPKFDELLTEESLRSLMYGNFLDIDSAPSDRRYEEIKSIEIYQQVALSYLDEYNNTHRSKIDIVLFRFALEHLARLCRVLAIPCGSLLMVGVGGSGRQSLTGLASFMAGYGIFQPEIGSSYGLHEWREDVKKILKNSGGTGKDYVFLVTENQIKEEAFLVDIDSLLNSGEVPNLFTIEERQEIIEMTRLAAQAGNRNLDISVLRVLTFFVDRCKEKLHLMLCFSPIGDTFRTRLRLYPSLVNCCTIDWFHVWPEDALEQVALHSTRHVDIAEDIKFHAVAACKYFHRCAKDVSSRFYNLTGRRTYITTAAFLDLVKNFVELMQEKQDELVFARDRYIGGLDKLDFAAKQIAKMRGTLSKLQPQLEKSARETAETMRQIETENVSVARATRLVQKDENMANLQAGVAMNLKTECEADLAKAMPALEEAIAALNTLKPSDIAVVKTMKSPPEGVRLVMAAVCVMLSIPPAKIENRATGAKVLDYWGPSKRLLADMKFLENLRQYDKDNIPDNIVQEIKKTYISDKNFEPKVVARASQAAEGLCKWVRAMMLYDRVAKEVAPKKAKLAAAQHEYEKTVAFLNERRRMLAELTDKLAILTEKLRVTLAKKIELENEANNCRNQLIRAEKLINGLGGEKERWLAAAGHLQNSLDALPGDILISCGTIAYLGPFTSQYRTESMEKWKVYMISLRIPCSDRYSFVDVLGSEIKVNSWNIFGLPRDAFSTENAIIMDNSKRWSLFVDPQSQANKWIRNMEKENKLEIVKVTDANYMKVIERAIEYGKPVLIENVLEDLPPALDPILRKKIYKIGILWYITLGDQVLEYGMRFRLYITTKLRNPHYLPEVFNKVTLINFALTMEALEDQLLGIVVAKERPDLQEKREYLIVQSAGNKKALKQVEDNILKTLSVAGAKILEDEEAIEILDSSKILSIDIIKKQVAAKKTEEQIEGFRQHYRAFARHGSALYYTITDLPNIDPMYQYSLAWFINLYVISIDMASKSKLLERRLAFLRETFTYNLYQNVCRSLFEKDKTFYSFILYTTILLMSNGISKEEMHFLIGSGLAPREIPANPAADWIPDRSWADICRIGQVLPRFQGFADSFTRNIEAWKAFSDQITPEDSPMPDPWQGNLTPFQKLIVMKIIRTDKIIVMVQRFIANGLGLRFVLTPPFDIGKSYADSNCLLPLLFILSPGADPMGALTKFAGDMHFLERFQSISLGQGQGPIAQALIEQARTEGSWVCLQNCHLAASWMPTLDQICESFEHSNTHISFRLWLTSYPSEKFPISILQNGIKMTNEPPTGLRNNIMRSYLSESSRDIDLFDTVPQKKRAYLKLLYSLCFFHAVVQERRNYGAQGWNIKYGFNESDLQISAEQLRLYLEQYQQIPFKAIAYLTGECNYGGRVTDDRDRRCLITILGDFYNSQVLANPNYLFANVGHEYGLPKRHEAQDYIDQIQTIPMNPPPEVYGLHTNAGITRDYELAKNFLESILSVQGVGGTSVADTSRQDEQLLAMKNDIYGRVPELFDVEEERKRYPVVYTESMNTVLIQEMERFNVILLEIRQSLTMLEKAVKGMTVMTPALEILAKHILSARIPPTWRKACAYPSLKPLPSFIDDLLQRLHFLQMWSLKDKPLTFWISGFSFVHAFLTAAIQNFARKYQIPIDRIDFDFQVLPAFQLDTSPVDGVYVYGMFLVGARWDMPTMLLAESYPKILWDPMPIVWMKPCEISKLIDIRGRYECPLYITSERFGVLKTTGHSTNYVLSLLLDTNHPIAHWIKRGLALLCQLDN